MDKILVIGCSAAGKSTVARKLGELLGIEVIHLDKKMWKPGCRLSKKHEEPPIVEEAMNRPRWIIDGNYTASLPMRLAEADTVVLIDYPRLTCLMRAMKRLSQYKGTTRPDMGKDCPEELNLNFLKWIWQYPEKEKPELERQLREHGSHATVYVLHNQAETDEFLNHIQTDIAPHNEPQLAAH